MRVRYGKRRSATFLYKQSRTDLRQGLRGSPQCKGLTDNGNRIERDGQDGQIRALEDMAVSVSDRRGSCGYGGDPGLRDHAVQGADRGGPGMVLPAAPL